jgi:hypothetical protein
LFNEAYPNDSVNIEYVSSAAEKNCSYDKALIETTITNYSSYFRKGALYRNTQKIGDFEMTGHKANNARANAESKHKINNVRTEVSYAPVSYHGNIPDKVMGIQENKNQWESKDMPINLTRMFEHFHNKKASEIWNYFIKITSQISNIPSDSSDSDDSDDSHVSSKSDNSNNSNKSEQQLIVICADPSEEQIINVCEKYINYLKENRNSKTIEIYKLQCEALNIDQ